MTKIVLIDRLILVWQTYRIGWLQYPQKGITPPDNWLCNRPLPRRGADLASETAVLAPNDEVVFGHCRGAFDAGAKFVCGSELATGCGLIICWVWVLEANEAVLWYCKLALVWWSIASSARFVSVRSDRIGRKVKARLGSFWMLSVLPVCQKAQIKKRKEKQTNKETVKGQGFNRRAYMWQHFRLCSKMVAIG